MKSPHFEIPQSIRNTSFRRLVALVLSLAVLLSLLPGFIVASSSTGQATPSEQNGNTDSHVTAAGSATLGTVLVAAAEALLAESPDVTVDVERSSSGAGLKRFCAGEVDLATSGRQIRDEEAAACEEAGLTFDEFEVAFDGVAIVVNPANIDVKCITVDQLQKAWEPDSEVARWPDDDIALYGMGEKSGTFQFFTQVMAGEEGVVRSDYNVTEGQP